MTLTIIFVISLIVNLYISNEVGNIAETREIGREKGFWLSFIFSPILGILFVLASRPLSDEKVNQIRNRIVVTIPKVKPTPEQQRENRNFVLTVVTFVLVFTLPAFVIISSFNN